MSALLSAHPRSHHATFPPVAHGELLLPAFRPRHANRAGSLRIRYCSIGDTSLPTIVVLGGVSASATIITQPQGTAGWWDAQVGNGRGIDTRQFRILGMDFITGRQIQGADCHSIDTTDQADALAALLNALHVTQLHALVGASYGAMVGLAFAARYPERLAQLVAISGAHRAHPRATAIRSIQRNIITLAAEHDDPVKGVTLARALAITAYRDHAEFGTRFTGAPLDTGRNFRFPVEDYLEHNGRKHAAAVDADDYRQLSESLDLHAVDPAAINTPTTLIAANPDFVVPLTEMQVLAETLAAPCRLHILHSVYGHDAFLKEQAQLTPLLRTALTEGVVA